MVDTKLYQVGINGPLNQRAIDFLLEVKITNKWSYKTLGEHLGISGPFAHAILHKPSNITTSTAMQTVAQGIDRLEKGITEAPELTGATAVSGWMLEHSYHLRSGVVVCFRLPEDITEKEAGRLGMFIQSLSQ